MSDAQSSAPTQRAFRRTELSSGVLIEVEDAGHGGAPPATEGKLLDVAVGGLLARVPAKIALGTRCTVRFTDDEVGDLEVRGCVRSVRPQDAAFLLGIEFDAHVEALRPPSTEDHLDGFALDATRVLVIDDEHSVVELLYRFLSSRGCEVNTARSGEEALDVLRSSSHDVTVLDLRMPGLDGLEVLETIREENLAAGAIWAMSGYATDAEAREALRRGAADFISKPIDLKYLEWSMQLHRASC